MNTTFKLRSLLSIALMGAALMSSPALAQTNSLTSTTLGAAVVATDRSICLAAATGVVLPTFAHSGSTLFVGTGEPMRVQSQDSTLCFQVARTKKPAAWASGTAVYLGPPQQFYTYDPVPGSACTTGTMETRPWVNTSNGVVWDCVSSKMVAINGPATALTGLTALGPVSASTVDVGSDTLPFRKLYLKTAIQFEGDTADAFETTVTVTDPTADRTITVPDATITLSGAQTYWDGTTSTAAGTVKPGLIVHTGTVALASASPSAVTVTGFSPAFTSTSTFTCTASPTGASAAIAAAGIAVTLTSASSVTFTGANTVTTVINYICMGY